MSTYVGAKQEFISFVELLDNTDNFPELIDTN